MKRETRTLTVRLSLVVGIVLSLAALAATGFAGQAATVRIAVFDDTESYPLHARAEIWIRGVGSWWLAQETVRNISGRQVGVKDSVHIYPDGRNGKEFTVAFTITAEMCRQGCPRDMIQIDVSDTKVTVHGAPIRAANDVYEIELERR